MGIWFGGNTLMIYGERGLKKVYINVYFKTKLNKYLKHSF